MKKVCENTLTIKFYHRREDLMQELFPQLFEDLEVHQEHQELEVLEEHGEQQGMSMESNYEFVESIEHGLLSPTSLELGLLSPTLLDKC